MRKRSKWNRIWSQESKNVYINSMPNICCLFIQTDRVAQHSTQYNQSNHCVSLFLVLCIFSEPYICVCFRFCFCFLLLFSSSSCFLFHSEPKVKLFYCAHCSVCVPILCTLWFQKKRTIENKNETLNFQYPSWHFTLFPRFFLGNSISILFDSHKSKHSQRCLRMTLRKKTFEQRNRLIFL